MLNESPSCWNSSPVDILTWASRSPFEIAIIPLISSFIGPNICHLPPRYPIITIKKRTRNINTVNFADNFLAVMNASLVGCSIIKPQPSDFMGMETPTTSTPFLSLYVPQPSLFPRADWTITVPLISISLKTSGFESPDPWAISLPSFETT